MSRPETFGMILVVNYIIGVLQDSVATLLRYGGISKTYA